MTNNKSIEEKLKEKKENEGNYKKFLERMQYHDYQKVHFMPNEIFDDLSNLNIKPGHISFIYSYYYFISWLYRHGKYRDLKSSNKFIKESLGYNPNNKNLDYIIKENGILDNAGYTYSTKNFAVGTKGVFSDNAPKFLLVSDLSQGERGELYKKTNRNFKAKYPIKHMHRHKEDLEDKMLTGIYYDISNTHQINFDVFAFCMSNDYIGTIGFYIYSYLKNKTQLFGGVYQVSYEKLSEEIGMPYSTLAKYLDILRSYWMVIGSQNQDYYVEGLDNKDREANYYEINDNVNKFNFVKRNYTRVKGISLSEYKKMTRENS